MCLFTAKDILATIENLACRDFKDRKPFDALRQIMNVTLVCPTEITVTGMFVDVKRFKESFKFK